MQKCDSDLYAAPVETLASTSDKFLIINMITALQADR